MKCANINTPEFFDLQLVLLDEKMTHRAFQLNGDNPMHLTKDGKRSTFYNQAQKQFGKDVALALKAMVYNPVRTKVNTGVEPESLYNSHGLTTTSGMSIPELIHANLTNNPDDTLPIVRKILWLGRALKTKNGINVNNGSTNLINRINTALLTYTKAYYKTVSIPQNGMFIMTENGQLMWNAELLRSLDRERKRYFGKRLTWRNKLAEKRGKEDSSGEQLSLFSSSFESPAATVNQGKAALEWLKERYPDQSIALDASLGSQGAYAALSRDGKQILIDLRRGDFTEAYHEMYHRISLSLLTREQRDALYDEVRNRLGESKITVGVSGEVRTVIGEKMTNAEAEEYLAREFRTFMLFGEDYAFPPQSEKQKSFWDMIVDFFRSIFSADLENPLTMEDIFDSVKYGNFIFTGNEVMDYSDFGEPRVFSSIMGMNEMASQEFIQKFDTDFWRLMYASDNTGAQTFNDLTQGKKSIGLGRIYTALFERESRSVGYGVDSNTTRMQIMAAHANYIDLAYGIKIDNPTLAQIDVDDDTVEVDENSEEVRTDSSQNYGSKLERSTVKRAPSAVKLLFVGIQKDDNTGEQWSFKELFTQFSSVVNGAYNERALLHLLRTHEQINPAFKVINERLLFLKHNQNGYLRGLYDQIMTFANKNINRFLSSDNNGNINESLATVQRINEVRKWQANFGSSSSYEGRNLVSNGKLNTEQFMNALSSILSKSFITTNEFLNLTGIEIIPKNDSVQAQNFVSNVQRGILEDIQTEMIKQQVAGKYPVTQIINAWWMRNIYEEAFYTKYTIMGSELINEDAAIRKLNDKTKKLHALNEMTGFTTVTAKLKKFLNIIAVNPNRLEDFHQIITESGWTMDDSTPENIILQPYMRSSIIVNRLIDYVQNYEQTFVQTKMQFDERVYIGQQQELGSLSTEFSKMSDQQKIGEHLKLLLEGFILMPRTGERSRESVIIARDSADASAITAMGDVLDMHLLQVTEEGLGPRYWFAQSISEKIRDEIRRIIYVSGIPNAERPAGLRDNKNGSRYTIMDRYLSKYTVNASGKPIYEFDDEQRYAIREEFVVPETVKQNYRERIAQGSDPQEALTAATDGFFASIRPTLMAQLRDLIDRDVVEFREFLDTEQLISRINDEGSYKVYLDFEINPLMLSKILPEVQTSNATDYGMSPEQFQRFLDYVYTKYALSMIESINVTVGDLSGFAKFSEIYRRLETIGSTVLQSLKNTTLPPRFDNKQMDERDHLKFYAFEDILTKDNTTNDPQAFIDQYANRMRDRVPGSARAKFNEKVRGIRDSFDKDELGTDAQFQITPVFYKDIISRQVGWNNSMEHWYWTQMTIGFIKAVAYNRANDDKIMFRGEIVTEEKANEWLPPAWNIENGQPTRDGKPVSLFDIKFRPKPLKPKGSGIKQILTGGYGSYFMLKTSAAVLQPSRLNDRMLKIFFKMLDEGVDGYGFSSAFKESIPVQDKIDNDIDTFHANMIEMSGIGIQLVEEGKEAESVTMSKQMLANAFLDIEGNPFLSPLNKAHLKNLGDRRTQLVRSLEHVNAFEEFNKMGIFVDLANDKWLIFDKKLLVENITRRSNAGMIDEQAKQIIESVLTNDEYLEYSNASSLVQSLFLSSFRSNVIDVKVPGQMLIQESDVSIGEELLFWRYENGELKEPQVRIPLPSKYFGWIKSNFGGRDVSDYQTWENFKAAYAAGDPRIPDEMRKTLMNRTPLDNRHSVTPVEIVEYLAPWEGYSAQVPSQLVIPYGFDFDYDKLTFYLFDPTFKKGADGKSEVSYHYVEDDQTIEDHIRGLAQNPLSFINMMDRMFKHYTNVNVDIAEDVQNNLDKIYDVIADYEEVDTKLKNLLKEESTNWRKISKMITKNEREIRIAHDVKRAEERGEEINEFNKKYKNKLKTLYKMKSRLELAIVEPTLFTRKYHNMVSTMNEKFVKDILPLVRNLLTSPNLDVSPNVFFDKRSIANSLFQVFRESYMNEELIYSTLSPTQTGNIKATATQMLSDLVNPDLPRWNALVSPINNLKNTSVMLGGGQAIGVFASLIWLYSLTQQEDVNLKLNLPVGIIFEGYEPNEQIEIGSKLIDQNGDFTSDSLSEFIAAALDLAKTLAPFYSGFNETVASMIAMLLVSSSGKNNNIPYSLIQRFFGATPVKNLFKFAQGYSQKNGVSMPKALRAVPHKTLKSIRQEMITAVERMDLSQTNIRDMRYDITDIAKDYLYDAYEEPINRRDKGDVLVSYAWSVVKNDVTAKRNAEKQLQKMGPNDVLTNQEVGLMSMPIEKYIQQVLEQSKGDPKAFAAAIERYFQLSVKFIQAAKIFHAQSQQFSQFSINYRDASARFLDYDSLVRRITAKAEMESSDGFITGLETFNQNTFVDVYRNAMDVAYQLLHSKSLFSQIFESVDGEGIKVIKNQLPYRTTVGYSELESYFKTYAVLTGRSPVVKEDGQVLNNAQYVEDLLSVFPEHIDKNIVDMASEIKQVIQEDPVLLSRYGPKSPLWNFLYLFEGYYDRNSRMTNPDAITVGVTSLVLDDVPMETLKSVVANMKDNVKIGPMVTKFMSALALINFTINPANSYNSLGKLTQMESYNLLSTNLNRLVQKGILTTQSTKSVEIDNYINSLIYNSAGDPRIVVPIPYNTQLDMFAIGDWDDFSANGYPKMLSADIVDSEGRKPKYISVRLKVIDSEINDDSVKPSNVSVIYELKHTEEDSHHYRYMGASGIRKNLFLPVLGKKRMLKLTPWLEDSQLSKNVRAAGRWADRQEDNRFISYKRSRKYPRLIVDRAIYKEIIEKEQEGLPGEIIIPISDESKEVLTAALEGPKYMRFSHGNMQKETVVRVKGYSDITTLEEYGEYLNVTDPENYLDPYHMNLLDSGAGFTVIAYKYTGSKFIEGMYSLNTSDPVYETNPEIQNAMFDFFARLGYTRTEMSEILSESGVSTRAVVDTANKTLAHIHENNLDLADIPEEAAHVYIHLLGKDSGLYKQMAAEIEDYYTYKEVMDDKDSYPPNHDLVEEAIAKLIARELVNELAGEDIYPTQQSARSWFARLWKFIQDLFRSVNPKDELVQQLKEAVYQDASATPLTQEQVRKTAVVEDGRKSVNLVRRERNMVSHENLRQLQGIKPDAVTLNEFDSLFPGMDYLNDQKKMAFMELVKRGEVPITCKA